MVLVDKFEDKTRSSCGCQGRHTFPQLVVHDDDSNYHSIPSLEDILYQGSASW